MSLPLFSFDTEVSAETAKQDRIQVIYGGWELQGSTEEIDALRQLMGAPYSASRDIDGLADSETFGRIFNRPQYHGLQRPPLSVRTRILRLGDTIIYPPLFSGRCVFTSYAREHNRRTRCRVYLELLLNPTRYYLHQPFSPLPDPLTRGAWPEARLFGNSFPSHYKDEFAYDGKDNWIPNTPRAAVCSNPARWKKHLQAYLYAVPRYFEEELDRINAIHPMVSIGREERVTLMAAEIYWECETPNPLRVISKLQQPFFSLVASNRRVRFYPTRDINADANGPSLTAHLGSGEQLRVYAKTNSRIRTEVAFTFKRNGYKLEGGHTSDEWYDLPEMLEKLAEQAARRVNWAFAHFRNQIQIIPSGVSADDLLQEIGVCSRDLATAKAIKRFLVQFSSIAARGTTERIARACQCLGRSDVLEYRPDAGQGGNYVVTAPYREALQDLQHRQSF